MSDGSMDRCLLSEEEEVALEWGVPHRGLRLGRHSGEEGREDLEMHFPQRLCCFGAMTTALWASVLLAD